MMVLLWYPLLISFLLTPLRSCHSGSLSMSGRTDLLGSAIGTPLFYDHPEALAFLDLSKDILLPPEEIAKAMIALLSDSSYPPGTVLEVGDVGRWRPVSLLNDPGPQGRATVTSKKDDAIAGVKKMLDMDLDEGSENIG
jgi:hypothetical protein